MKPLRDIFSYADVQIVVYTLEENGVHALSAEGDAEFYADDETERYSEEFLENRELQTLLKIDNRVNQHGTNNSWYIARKITTIESLLITVFNTSQKKRSTM